MLYLYIKLYHRHLKKKKKLKGKANESGGPDRGSHEVMGKQEIEARAQT